MGDAAWTIPKVGDTAPDFALPSLDGVSVSLSSYREKRVVVYMWASW
jgi:peroxiredoxin